MLNILNRNAFLLHYQKLLPLFFTGQKPSSFI